MPRKFGTTQLYAVEEIVNAVADTLVNAGFEAGEAADDQQHEGSPLADMSGIVDRLLEARTELDTAIGLAREYEIDRTYREESA